MPKRAATEPPSGLTDRERSLLAFERSWWAFDGEREAAIREKFSLSPAEYHRVLNEVIDLPEALEIDPLLVRRLRRQRAARRLQRSRARTQGDIARTD